MRNHPFESADSYLFDSDRLATLAGTGLMDSDVDPSYDRLCRLAARLLDAPTAIVTLVDDRRQFFKSSHGLGEPLATLRQTPVSYSFCQHVVVAKRPIAVNDSRLDPLVRDNPAVAEFGAVAYLGVPLTIDDQVIGAFCVVDGRPRIWTDGHLVILGELSEAVLDVIRQDVDRLGPARQVEPGGRDRSQLTGPSADHHREAELNEEALRDAKVRLDTVQSAGDIATWTWDIPNDSVVADANLARLFSVSPEDANGGPIRQYIRSMHPDDADRVSKVIGEAVANGTDFREEYRLVQADGSVRWVSAKGQVVRDAEHRALSLHGVAVDITERKLCQQIIAESENRYRTLIHSVDEGFCIIEMVYNPEGQPVDYRHVEANQAFEKVTGMADAVGKTIRELCFDIETYWIEAFGFVVRTGETLRLEGLPQHAGNRRFEVHASPIGLPDESRVALLFKDLGEGGRPERGINPGEARPNLQTTLSRLDQAVIVTDDEAKVVFINPAAEKLCGWTVEAAFGRPLKEIFRIPGQPTGVAPADRPSGTGRVVARIRRGFHSLPDLIGDGYSIAVTSKMTGISQHALLVWERRYGFPVPTRSLLGGRRYSAEQVAVLTHIAKLAAAGRPAAEMIGDYQLGILVI